MFMNLFKCMDDSAVVGIAAMLSDLECFVIIAISK